MSFVVYGVYDAWYDCSGYREIHQVSPWPQEQPYSEPAIGAVPTKESLPEVSLRENANTMINTEKSTEENLKEGKELYLDFCAACHGKNGDGIGLMGTVASLGKISKTEKDDLSRYLSGFVGDDEIDIDYFRNSLDQQLFFTIGQGGGSIMPGFKDAMDPNERWKLVNYIKSGVN